MTNKTLFLDIETTGFDPVNNDIIQIAGIIEIDDEVKEEFNFFCQPFNYGNISPKALEIQNRTIEDLKGYDIPEITYFKLNKTLSKYVSLAYPYRLMPAGQNVGFDIRFLNQFFRKHGDKYLHYYLTDETLDLMSLTAALRKKGLINPVNLKLESIADYFDMEFTAHDALSDVRVTRELINKILKEYVI